MGRPFIAFHFGLVQDVAVLRPVVLLARESTGADLHLFVSARFKSLDPDGKWMAEIEKIGSQIGVAPLVYESAFDVIRQLGRRDGMIIAGSESNVRAHQDAHDLFRAVPGHIRTVTLQHGLECVGFLHNRRHDATAGRNVRFAADIAVAWFELSALHSLAARERNKIYVAGPPALIDPVEGSGPGTGEPVGLVCENLHSVRFVNGQLRQGFLETFTEFARRLAMIGQRLALRPHPAGRFTEKRGVAVPDNVEVSQRPLYELDLTRYAYVISAPSTILMDFALAGVPVAVWRDADGLIDTANFPALPHVASVDDWWRFHWAATWERQALVRKQEAFTSGLAIPEDVKSRYVQLLSQA